MQYRKNPLKKQVKIALGRTAFSSEIIRKTVTVETLFNQLEKPEIREKKDGKYFIFASFSEKIRNAQTLQSYYGAAIDIDHGNLNIQDIIKAYEDYTYFIYTTFNHKIKGNRYRVIIPYKTAVSPADHVNAVLYLSDLVNIKDVDIASKTLSLPTYLPACSKKTLKFYRSKKHIAKFFNPISSYIKKHVEKLKIKILKTEETLKKLDINNEVFEGERDVTLSRLVGKFIKTGANADEVFHMARTFNETKFKPPLPESEVDKVVKSVLKTHSRNHDDLDWGFSEIMRRMEDKAQAKEDFEHICKIIANQKLKNKLSAADLDILISELRNKTNVRKAVINQSITQASLEIQGAEETILETQIVEQAESIKERFKNWVYVGTEDKLYNMETGDSFKREAFNIMFTNHQLKASIFNVLIKYSLIPKVSKMEFDPEQDYIYTRDKVTFVNTYIEPDVIPEKGNVDKVLNHFRYLIPDRYERDIVLNFIAFMVQNPGKKIRWMLVIKGGKGIGKTLIAEHIILNVIGASNLGKVSNTLIKSEFNAWQLNKQLIIFEEFDTGKNQQEKEKFTESLRSFITDGILPAHKKGVDPYDVVNKSCCMGFTNKEIPISITMDERRFCMIRTDVSPKPDAYYEDIVKFCSENQAALRYYFLNREIKNFRYQVAPPTTYTEEIKALSMPWPSSILYDLAKGKFPEYSEFGCLTYRDIVALIKQQSTGKFRNIAEEFHSAGSSSSKSLQEKLKDLKFKKIERLGKRDSRFFIKGEKQFVWVLPGCAKKVCNYAPKTVVKLMNEIHIPIETDDYNI